MVARYRNTVGAYAYKRTHVKTRTCVRRYLSFSLRYSAVLTGASQYANALLDYAFRTRVIDTSRERKTRAPSYYSVTLPAVAVSRIHFTLKFVKDCAGVRSMDLHAAGA